MEQYCILLISVNNHGNVTQAWVVYFAAMVDAVLQYTLTMRFLVEVNLKSWQKHFVSAK